MKFMGFGDSTISSIKNKPCAISLCVDGKLTRRELQQSRSELTREVAIVQAAERSRITGYFSFNDSSMIVIRSST
jgi:hypothetical protein